MAKMMMMQQSQPSLSLLTSSVSDFNGAKLHLQVQYKRKVQQPKGALYVSASSEKKILIMGGTRFIGIFLSRLLVKEGHQVTLFTRGKSPIAKQLPGESDQDFADFSSKILHLKGDRKDYDFVKSSLSAEGFDVVYDINGREAEEVEPILDALPKLEQYIYCSSAGVYLKSDVLPHCEVDAVDPKSRHKGKLETESLLQSKGVNWTSIRPVYIYGPLNYNPVEEWFFHRLKAGRPIPVPNSGIQISQLGHVKDLATAFLAVLGNEKASREIFNISGEKYVTFDGLARACAKAGGFPEPEIVHYNPKEFDFGKKKAFPFRDQHFFASVEKAKHVLGWKPEFDISVVTRHIIRFVDCFNVLSLSLSLSLLFPNSPQVIDYFESFLNYLISPDLSRKMIRLRTYACLSFIATLSIIHHAFTTRGQFYPAAVYLSTSKISLMLLLNMCLVLMLALWHLVKLLFLGSLREAEVERLNEQAWRELMEILFAITIFRQDFSSGFLPLVVTLLLIKALHWLAQKRVEFIETTPNVSKLAHVRIVSFMAFLLVVDGLFMYSSVRHLVRSRQASVSLFFSFEYMILATTTVAIFVKYVFFVTDMIMDGQWEKKPVYTFYLELIRDLLHLSMYICFFFVIFMNYGVPLHLLRELYETFRNFQIRVSDYLRYRKITSNMNDRFPDATPEELTASDATCIICREEMTTAKKLICGHLFHVHCLRSWLERQQTCPTCRALVVPPENGTSTTAAGQRGLHQGSQQGTSSSGAQGSETRSSAGGSNDSLSRHHARLQAAASAAAMYGKSMVYPSANTIAWSQPGTEKASTEAHHHPSSSSQLPGENSRAYANIPEAKLENMKNSLETQLEVLRNRLHFLEKRKVETTGEADNKGKTVVDASVDGAE